ncbi:MAG: fluoride efflux transporter CrcB [Flavobacteriaceae bacterium]|nr:fluoride efflux transporter CrcB [Flavobacteriaceae bacterium]|tara:strand:+ start:52 stop:411 length:360 start_codon:yes stop_codon:yes gene_type:complete
MIYLLIGLGGGLGAISRFLISDFLTKISFFGIPVGTFFVNIIGCFLIGIFIVINNGNGSTLTKEFFIIGFLGSFTTFSAFTKESLIFFNQGSFIAAFSYIIFTVSLCLLSTYLGFKIFK